MLSKGVAQGSKHPPSKIDYASQHQSPSTAVGQTRCTKITPTYAERKHTDSNNQNTHRGLSQPNEPSMETHGVHKSTTSYNDGRGDRYGQQSSPHGQITTDAIQETNPRNTDCRDNYMPPQAHLANTEVRKKMVNNSANETPL